ncbi:DUF1194 domain-containing protein [Phyllobacterium lublinensis]|uniref:DUF1194 domain-containing protein n=1 Tax=Phyllobacterium lublinensis TaxID=2875708 RepID=UPI001CCF098A|nr:DUF1194 domain-containing protein [Phyllobacterium sp. 2063]MBZ9655258.1 DUF1194 domain-containing protein [Phyllobacterium sp. 2063]
MKLYCMLLVCFGLSGSGTPVGVSPVKVDVELVLAVDVSYSMEIDELRIQRQGYVDAFHAPALIDAIQSGPVGKIAVTYVEWGGSAVQVVPWTLIDGPGTAAQFADALDRQPMSRIPFTSISNTLAFSRELFRINLYQGMRRVVDISGDGPNNAGVPAPIARNLAVAEGIVIDGLPIMLMRQDSASIPDLDAYYENCVIGGEGAFLLKITAAGNFANTILRKLTIEILGQTISDMQGSKPPLKRVDVRGDYNCFIGEEMQEGRIEQ